MKAAQDGLQEGVTRKWLMKIDLRVPPGEEVSLGIRTNRTTLVLLVLLVRV